MMLQRVLRADGEQARDLDSDPLGSNLAIFQPGDSDLVTSPSLSSAVKQSQAFPSSYSGAGKRSRTKPCDKP